MSNKIRTDDKYYNDIADEINILTGEDKRYKSSELANELASISNGDKINYPNKDTDNNKLITTKKIYYEELGSEIQRMQDNPTKSSYSSEEMIQFIKNISPIEPVNATIFIGEKKYPISTLGQDEITKIVIPGFGGLSRSLTGLASPSNYIACDVNYSDEKEFSPAIEYHHDPYSFHRPIQFLPLFQRSEINSNTGIYTRDLNLYKNSQILPVHISDRQYTLHPIRDTLLFKIKGTCKELQCQIPICYYCIGEALAEDFLSPLNFFWPKGNVCKKLPFSRFMNTIRQRTEKVFLTSIDELVSVPINLTIVSEEQPVERPNGQVVSVFYNRFYINGAPFYYDADKSQSFSIRWQLPDGRAIGNTNYYFTYEFIVPSYPEETSSRLPSSVPGEIRASIKAGESSWFDISGEMSFTDYFSSHDPSPTGTY